MAESKYSKFVWIVVGAIVGGGISIFYKQIVEPFFDKEPIIEIAAQRTGDMRADLQVMNNGNGSGADVLLTIWALHPSLTGVEILSVEASGAVVDADCQTSLVVGRLLPTSLSAIPQPLATDMQAVRISCSSIRAGERWRGEISMSQQSMALIAYVEYDDVSRTIMFQFED